MNMSQQCDSNPIIPSPQDQFFKLKSTPQSKNKTLLDTETDLSDFLLKQLKSKNIVPNTATRPLKRQDEIIKIMFSSKLVELPSINCPSSVDIQDKQKGAKIQKGTQQTHQVSSTLMSQIHQNNFNAAIPSTNKCFVCNENFQNYFQHISTVIHKKRQNSYLIQGNSKVTLQTVIANLINSLEKQHTPRKSQAANSSIRERVNISSDDLLMNSEPKKRKQGEDLEPACSGSVESTSILMNNLTRKQSFF